MIHENTRRSKRQAKVFTEKVQIHAIKFFTEAKDLIGTKNEKPEVIRLYKKYSFDWDKICRNANLNSKRHIYLHSDEFEQVTKYAYRRVFFQNGAEGRKKMLRTIKIIEGRPGYKNIIRDVYYTFLKFYSGK